ncbi:ABC transporter ATP-binding protein [Chryseolinea sp. T2]|uniref:ABC transporter ATP-binding protein n=1 Tax=Chryseolinea sp. T2 TaxID=3129255 RepID=UPI0030780A67
MGKAIEVESVSKLYRLGTVGTGTLMHDLNRWWAGVRGLDDPYVKIASVNNRKENAKNGEVVWALQDINFSIDQGEVIGIVGKNGAGKSTLLKILSRITAPTLGEVRIRGRISSLLEVGTGFHPEMTGRENVYMNGTILGMRRVEIDRKFKEIVEFSGVAKYIDTPVKRYSSGMMVRLGFAVAAFLEPEILIVDEVLAVGDAEFQKKAMGKMQSVSEGSGRTVLFVSHNLAAIENLCPRSILMSNGRITRFGKTQEILEEYLNDSTSASTIGIADLEDRRGVGGLRFVEISFLDESGKSLKSFRSGMTAVIRLHYKANDPNTTFTNCRISIAIKKDLNPLIVFSSELAVKSNIKLKDQGHIDFTVFELPLSEGQYDLNLFIEGSGEIQDWLTLGRHLDVVNGDFYGTGVNYPIGWQGKTVLVRHKLEIS